MTGLLAEDAAQPAADRQTEAGEAAGAAGAAGSGSRVSGRGMDGARPGRVEAGPAVRPAGSAGSGSQVSGEAVHGARRRRAGVAAGSATGGAAGRDGGVVARRLERHRPELRAHCRRMLGSAAEADDAVQETMVRAWRSYHRFQGRASLRSWLHRIATNVCFDMLRAPQRRARPIDPAVWTAAGSTAAGAPVDVDDAGRSAAAAAASTAAAADPAEQAVGREDVRLAFVAALLHLPPRQRAVLLLCEVLRWRASEVAELLGTSVASVNSALQRARATLAELHGAGAEPGADPALGLDDDRRALLQRCTAAFDRYDVTSLVALLR